MNRFVAVAVVVVAMPFVVGLARASFGPEPVAVVEKAPRELTAVVEPVALRRKTGLAVVAMPDLPGAESREPGAENGVPSAERRAPSAEILRCPDIRAIVTGASPFAIVAWDDLSTVVKTGQTISTPSGPTKVTSIRSSSLSFAQADTTIQCKLPVR